MGTIGRTVGYTAAVVLTLIAFVALNVVGDRLLRPVRLDVTQGKQFTLTQGSRNIARSPAEPVTLRFYYNSSLAAGQPQLQLYAKRVGELLEEFARVSEGKVRLERIEPKPFSEQEDAAVEAGLRGVQINTRGDTLYFGLVGTNTIDTREVVPFFDPRREEFLEYDLAKLIHNLANPVKPKLGWISPLQLEGGFTFDPRTRQPAPLRQWQIIDELKAIYDVQNVPTGAGEIPSDISVLLVVHPKGLEPRMQYAIDQFVLRGGRLLLFLDPRCESDQPNPMGGVEPDRASALPALLAAWGVEVPDGRVVADQDIALRVQVGGQTGNPQQVPYVVWLQAQRESMNTQDPVTGQVQMVTFASAGHIRPRTGEGVAPSTVTITPLITTTQRASTLPVTSLGERPDPLKLFTSFVPGTEKLTLAARLSGPAKTAFPDGPPKNSDGQPVAPSDKHLAQSTTDINVLLFADADVLADAMWMREFNFLGSRGVQKFADNADLLAAGVDNFAGSNDLIALRARQSAARPFTKVEQIRRNAEQQYQKEESRLNEKLQQSMARIAELQGQRGDDATAGIVLTSEQQAEIQRVRGEVVETRQQLRQVQFNLRRDVENLGRTLTWINVALVPVAVVVVAIVIALIRAADRRHARARLAGGKA